MQFSFTHIATLTFKHGYFSQGECNTFQLGLSEETKKCLLDLNLLIKPFDSGFHLLSGAPELLEGEWRSLSIQLNLKDSFFLNFTDLPDFNPSNSLLYFNNITVSKSNNSDVCYLHPSPTVDRGSLVRLCTDVFPLEGFGSEEKISIVDALGNTIQKGLKADIQGPSELGYCAIHGETEKFGCYFFPNSVFKKPIGIIELFPARLFEEMDPTRTLSFNISFQSQKTKWRYLLTDSLFWKFDKLSIIDSKKKEVFFTEKEIFLNGVGAIRCFESLEKIQMQDSHFGDFQMVENYGGDRRTGKIIIKNLPRASPEMLYHDPSFKDALYSHIFI
ncbi:MAG: hypothetical protein Q7J63_19365 [Rhodonellum sp.]|nr:hypothetical protein [Rhodonellum sp.]